MDGLGIFNALEACLWFLLASFCFWKGWRAEPYHRRHTLSLAVWLLLFGISDLIEIESGSWWRPWWLLILKGACLAGFLFHIWKLRRRGSPSPPS